MAQMHTRHWFDNMNFSPQLTWLWPPDLPIVKDNTQPIIRHHSSPTCMRSILLDPFHHCEKKKKCLLKGRNRFLGSVSSGHNSVSTTICRLTKLLFYFGFDIILPQTRGNNLWGEKENDHGLTKRKKSQALNI